MDRGAARQALQAGDFRSSCLGYLRAIEHQPKLAEDQLLQQELRAALQGFRAQLFAQQHHLQAAQLYRNVCRMVVESADLLHDCAVTCLAADLPAEALQAVQQARQLQPADPLLRESLDNVASTVVERWHFRMLNDKSRNQAYAAALQRAVQMVVARRQRQLEHGASAAQSTPSASAAFPAPSIPVTALDIGTGTGILSILAARAGCTSIVACEMNPLLAQLASSCIAQQHCQNVISVLPTHSSALQLGPSTGLPDGGVDIIVTELVDAGLLGEHITATLTHAATQLLQADGGIVIPNHARVHLALVECAAVRRCRTLIPSVSVNTQLRLQEHLDLGFEDRYTCENLALVPHRIVSQVARDVLSVRFTQTEAQTAQVFFELNADDCRPDAVALWWDMHLLSDPEQPDNPDYIVSTDPRRPGAPHCGWDQALYPLQHTSVKSVCRKGRQIAVQIRQQPSEFEIEVQGLLPMQDLAAAVGGAAEGAQASGASSAMPLFRVEVGEMDMAYINDEVYHAALSEQVNQVVLDCHCSAQLLVFAVRDHSYWTLACILSRLADRGREQLKAIIFVESTAGVDAMQRIADSQGLSNDLVAIASLAPAACIQSADEVVGEALAVHLSKLKIDASRSAVHLVADPVEGSGLIRQGFLRQLWALQRVLHHHGFASLSCTPRSLRVQAQVFGSELVRSWNAVDPTATAGVDVTLFNELAVRKYPELCIELIPDWRSYSGIQTVGTVPLLLAAAELNEGTCTFEDCVVANIGAANEDLPHPPAGVAFWLQYCNNHGQPFLCTGPADPSGDQELARPLHIRQVAIFCHGVNPQLETFQLRSICHAVTGIEVDIHSG